MSFINELKRRNVIRVGIAYAIAAWVLLQIVDLVLENIAAPPWVMQVFMLALAIGFPIAIIMAWAFEMTPDGIKLETEVAPGQSITTKTGQTLNRVIIGSLVLAVIFLVIDPFGEESLPISAEPTPVLVKSQADTQDPTGIEKSVAVLPFANRSTDPNDTFFAEGMHDDLLTQLAKIGSIKVISRTSVLAYKETTLKIPQIAEELGVATIVEGGIQRSGSRIRVNAQLINAATDEHLWAETYNRELTAENLFDIQAEIARSIAQALKATLSQEEEASIDRILTTNVRAWESYQRAVRMRESLTIEGMAAGISEADRALQLDPGFAAAWSLKAILLLQRYWFFDTNTATRDLALGAIQSGRAIDPTLPELDLAEGYYHYWGFRNYEKALELMGRALSALPNSARAHLAQAYVYRRLGNWEAHLAGMRRGTELDPMSFQTFGEMGNTLTVLHRFDEAAEEFAKIPTNAAFDAGAMWQIAVFQFWSSGDVVGYSHVAHLADASNPSDQWSRFESSLLNRDWEAAFQDVDEWPEKFLDTKIYRVSKQMLTGLVSRYAGNPDKATPLLLAAKQAMEAVLDETDNRYAILHSLCLINGGLSDIQRARQSCADSLAAAPNDAFKGPDFKFNAAVGLSLAGDTQASLELLKSILSSGIGPPMYMVMYHPAFDGMRQEAAYIKLLNTYGPETTQ